MTATVAAEVQVDIGTVRVVGRHRHSLGDIQGLADSIFDVGLLNPITLTAGSRLVAGQRRLEACRKLGWAKIPARFVESLDDAAAVLRAERDENTCRKEMLPSEKASLGEALLEIEAANAKSRQREHGGTAPGRNTSFSQEGSVSRQANEACARVGDALGIGRTSYYHLRFAYKAATDLTVPEPERVLARAALDRIDRGAGLQNVVKEFREQCAKREAQEVKDRALDEPTDTAEVSAKDDPDWIPPQGDGSQRAAAQRRALIGRLAADGYSSHQIGERLSILPGTVRRLARETGVTVGADIVLGRGGGRRPDSNRIIRETVHMLEGLGPGLDLIDYTALDKAEIGDWTASLSDSIRVLNRLNKQLREMAQ